MGKYIALEDLKAKARQIYENNKSDAAKTALSQIVNAAIKEFPDVCTPPLKPGDTAYIVEFSDAKKEYVVRQETVHSVEIFSDFCLIKNSDGCQYEYGILSFARKNEAEQTCASRNIEEGCWPDVE